MRFCRIVGLNVTIMVAVATLIGLSVLICGLLFVHRSVHSMFCKEKRFLHYSMKSVNCNPHIVENLRREKSCSLSLPNKVVINFWKSSKLQKLRNYVRFHSGIEVGNQFRAVAVFIQLFIIFLCQIDA